MGGPGQSGHLQPARWEAPVALVGKEAPLPGANISAYVIPQELTVPA